MIITNVFLNTTVNKLQLADIYFSSRIEHISLRLRTELEFNDISTKEKLNAFIEQHPGTHSPDEKNIFDGKYLLAIPGGIDPHVHFNTPGFEHRGDFEHGSLAAAYGGTTTVIDMPCTSMPPVTSAVNFSSKINAIRKRSYTDFALWGGVRGNDFFEMRNIKQYINELDKKGVAGYKAYLISGMESFRDLTEQQMLECADYIRSTGKILAVHAEDKNMIMHRSDELQKYGRNDWKDYCEARDDKAEAWAVLLMIDIARKTKCRVHIVHLSSALALKYIKKAKEEGLSITTETCPHYLHFTQENFNDTAISKYLKTAPPVKKAEDRDALWEGLKQGVIDMVSTDHAGCDPNEEKVSPDFRKVYGGIPGAEHRVPYLFSEGFLKNRLTLRQTINLLSINASRLFNFTQKGVINPGKDSDIALVDLWNGFTIKSELMHSKGKYTPFEGTCLNAAVRQTFLRGKRIKFEENINTETVGYGELINIFG